MITFEQARQIVRDNRASAYPPEADFQVATWGWENDEFFEIPAGAYAEVYVPRSPEDRDYVMVEDGPYIRVNKATGEYSEEYGLGDDGLPLELPGATPVGEPQAAP
ncbi:hypothetical protein SEA_GAIL_3 [Mycobacterium phage Gail]|uniref:Uncharacterized protein n=1 Tax=Mycobacterium phage Gail TaxID=2743994 RepID=A0A7D5FTG2_9CAUD|nr:immunity protein [Mycobacterium phage Gail]QLF84568.1 hypothetical protein SEA_GAIL_3 [Mycobacterium phage Gail]